MSQVAERGDRTIELSIVVPVYNGAATVGQLVHRTHQVFAGTSIEVILVNDGSQDDSERVCSALVDRYPETVSLIHLSRNFGEHNAVLAGLNFATGKYIAVMDDDGQNPPEEVVRMLTTLKSENYDAVYGRYRVKNHGWFRNLGSWFADRIANVMMKKPRELYLSSFKVINRFVRREVIKYRGPFPYIDGLIYRCTRNIGQIDVEHQPRKHGRSNYTFIKLVRLWMNMFLSFSNLPLRAVAWSGILIALGSLIALSVIWIQHIRTALDPEPGLRTVLCCVFFIGGLNLLVVGILGEYLGRLYLDQTGTPQFVVRYRKRQRGNRPARRSSGVRHPSRSDAMLPIGIPSETICNPDAADAALSDDPR